MISKLSNQNYWRSSDLALCATLCCYGYCIETIDRRNPSKAIFSIKKDERLDDLIQKYWGSRGKNAFIFNTLMNKGIDLAFGSDVPIEPLNPLHGIAAAVRRSRKGSRKSFYPDECITVLEAVKNFTIGPAIASGQEKCRGRLFPGYPADFIILSDDIFRVAPSRIYDIKVLATFIGGNTVYNHNYIKIK